MQRHALISQVASAQANHLQCTSHACNGTLSTYETSLGTLADNEIGSKLEFAV